MIIPNSVRQIGNYAFQYCTGFSESLIIPDSVIKIGIDAFDQCTGFSGTLTIGNSVTEIGEQAFFGCSGFTKLEIGNSVNIIGEFAFSKCSGFGGPLTIPNSVKEIGQSAFWDCSGFTSTLTIGNSVTKIGGMAFSGCSGFKTVNVLAQTPPRADVTVFSNYDATLYVPVGKKDTYQNSSNDCWPKFHPIEESDFSHLGVSLITDELGQHLPIAVYDMKGVKVADCTEGLAPGAYIIRQGNVSKKIIVR